MVACASHLTTVRSRKQENRGPGQPGQKVRTYLQNNQSKKSWRHGSSGRAPAYLAQSQVQTPVQEKKKKKYCWIQAGYLKHSRLRKCFVFIVEISASKLT
jgi:hypothetical protein